MTYSCEKVSLNVRVYVRSTCVWCVYVHMCVCVHGRMCCVCARAFACVCVCMYVCNCFVSPNPEKNLT